MARELYVYSGSSIETVRASLAQHRRASGAARLPVVIDAEGAVATR